MTKRKNNLAYYIRKFKNKGIQVWANPSFTKFYFGNVTYSGLKEDLNFYSPSLFIKYARDYFSTTFFEKKPNFRTNENRQSIEKGLQDYDEETNPESEWELYQKELEWERTMQRKSCKRNGSPNSKLHSRLLDSVRNS